MELREKRPGKPEGSSQGEVESPSYIRRHEQKFEVGVAAAAFLREEISRNLPIFEFYEGYPHTCITTVYFDTDDQAFYEQAVRSYDDNFKIRVKEYSYSHRDGGFLSLPYCYVELKRRIEGTVVKRRIRILKGDLNRLLAGDDLWEAVSGGSSAADAAYLHAAYQELRDHLSRFRVQPTSIVTYRRSVFQQSEQELRITFDDDVAVYAPVDGLYSQLEALTPDTLPAPLRRYPKVILEIKCPSCQYPLWLQGALKNHCSKRLSKFTTSIRFLREPQAADDGERPATGGKAADDPDETRIVPSPIDY
ncbi:MAG: VTC domain-containing protein [Planctomycetes bacterium]|nr:VTC domain-containing protein [Planctomycetota bacterium]